MKSCQNCRWDRLNSQNQKMISCEQGHIRTFQGIIKDCHAWGEKKILACKLINPQGQCQDWELKIQKNWCKECINHIFVMPKLEEET